MIYLFEIRSCKLGLRSVEFIDSATWTPELDAREAEELLWDRIYGGEIGGDADDYAVTPLVAF